MVVIYLFKKSGNDQAGAKLNTTITSYNQTARNIPMQYADNLHVQSYKVADPMDGSTLNNILIEGVQFFDYHILRKYKTSNLRPGLMDIFFEA